MSGLRPFLAGFAAAAALAATLWFLRIAPERERDRAAMLDAEDRARKSGRAAADSAVEAQSERQRAEAFKAESEERKNMLTGLTRPTPPTDGSAGAAGGHDGAHAAGAMSDPPEKWDRQRINQEIQNVANAWPGVPVPSHPRLPLLVRAMKVRPDESVDLLKQILGSQLPTAMSVTAAGLAAELRDARLVTPLFERWRKDPEAGLRFATLRALALLPGNEIVPGLLDAWMREDADRFTRGIALEGLGRRGMDVARDAALKGTTGGISAPMRQRALVGLRDFAETGGWKDDTLIPLFGRCLRSADGSVQRKLALVTLEGFWNQAAAKELGAFADEGSAWPELALRARKASNAMLAGEPRPADAGVPERGLRDEQ